jgi:hypothetical protein
VNFRKAKVSKGAWLLAPVLGLLGSASVPPPLALLRAPDPIEMAYAEPPPLRELPLSGRGEESAHAAATGSCANARRELRFEMLAVNDPDPPPRRNSAVCLAVYRPSDGTQSARLANAGF